MSEDNKPTKPVKEKVKDELTSTDDNKDSLTEETLRLNNNRESLKQAKE